MGGEVSRYPAHGPRTLIGGRTVVTQGHHDGIFVSSDGSADFVALDTKQFVEHYAFLQWLPTSLEPSEVMLAPRPGRRS